MMPNTFKRILSAVMALVLMVALLPAVAVTAEAAGSDVIDAAIFFSDLHSNEDDYKPETIKGVFGAIRDTELPVSSVTSCGDAFSVNYDWDAKPNGKYTGDTSTITSGIRNAMGHPFLPVNYVWSDHDRYAKVGDSVMDSESGFIYGLDSKYANYYIYELSMADIGTNDRYSTNAFSTTEEVQAVIAAFKSTAQTLDKSKPLFIASHMPLIDRRNDNGHAYLWATAINEVAKEMDVIFLSGHNHSKDLASDYYIAKGKTVDIASTKDIDTTWNVDLEGIPVTLNFTHLTAGYLAPASTDSISDTTRENCVIVASITESSIQLTTYSATGKYTGRYAVDTPVDRDFAHRHDYSIEVIAPTCDEEGYSIYTCKTCGEWFWDDGVEPLGHDYVDVVTPPTLNSLGYTTHTCQRCHHSYTDTYVELEHDYEVTVVAPSCTSAGYTTYICKECGHRYNENYVSSLGGHNYETSIVAPTCTEKGYTVHACTNCDHSYNDTYVDAIGHTNNAVVTKPTCTEKGFTTYTCTSCGEVSVGSFVPMANHIYDCVKSGNQLIFTCRICQHSYSLLDEAEFSYNKVSSFDNNNSYVITLYSNGKYYALSHTNNKISVVPVTVSNNKVVSEVTEDLLWNYNNKVLSYEASNRTYKLSATSTRLSLSTSKSTNVVFSGNQLKVGTNYLRYASNTVTLNKTATTTYLFNQVEN